ncbi:MAG: hypothetical protein ACOYJF_04050 [Prevotella sp.]|jgi:hypothetical protein
MKNKLWLLALPVLLLTFACSSKQDKKPAGMGKMNEEMKLKGDKTVYGLACEGCTDSVVYLLPSNGSDPVKYDIQDAMHNHKVLGKIKTGDWIGLLPNAKDTTIADIVVDLDQLKGIWCYIVMPKMRDYDKMSPRLQKRLMRNMPDSIKETFLIPREYGFWLKRHWQAQSVGYVRESNSLADESPVVYPPLGYFTEWHIWNCMFVMVSGDPKFEDDGTVKLSKIKYDTCSIDFLGPDSLVLSDRDGSRSYYRKDDINDVNKKAKAIANMRSKQALQQVKDETE